MIRKSSALAAAFLLASTNLSVAASAQGHDPRPALGNIITAFQQCGPPAAFQLLSPQMFELVASQTGGSGCYAPIAAAGPITNMQVLQQAQFPVGPMYLVRVTHQAGPVDWFIGFNQFNGKIEYLSFQQVQGGGGGGGNPSIQTGPSPSAGGPGTGAPPPPPKTDGGNPAEECQMFPTMCQ